MNKAYSCTRPDICQYLCGNPVIAHHMGAVIRFLGLLISGYHLPWFYIKQFFPYSYRWSGKQRSADSKNMWNCYIHNYPRSASSLRKWKIRCVRVMYKIRSHEIPKCALKFSNVDRKKKRSNIPSEFSLKEIEAATSTHNPAKVTNILCKNMTPFWRKKKEQQRLFTSSPTRIGNLSDYFPAGFPVDLKTNLTGSGKRG